MCLKNSFLVALIALIFVSCSGGSKVASKEGTSVALTKDYSSGKDVSIEEFIKPYNDAMVKEMNEVLIVSDLALTKDQPESLLGNLVADIVLKKSNEKCRELSLEKVDICLLNNGGLRTSLPKGELTRGKIFELMPFENEMVVLTMTGEQIRDMFTYVAAANGVPMAGIRLGIKDSQANTIKINTIDFDIKKTYRVVTSDYLGAGGDKMTFFSKPVKMEKLKYKLRDALIDYMKEEGKKGTVLTSKLDGRIYHE